MKSSFLLVSFLGCLAVCHADAVRLQVVGPDGKPIAGAKVHVVETSGNWRNQKTELPLDLQSDEAGKIAFESKNPLPDPKDKDKTAQSRVFVLAQVRAAGLTLEQVVLKAGDNTLALRKGKTLGGVLLGEDEKPVAGVRIRLRSIGRKGDDQSKQMYFPGNEAPQTQSDAEGKWSFDGLPLEGTAGITVADPRFKNESFSFDVAQGAPPLFLERGATIKGRLLKPDGTPAGGVKFYAGDFQNQPLTNADGTFEVGGLGDARVYLQVLSSSNDKDKLPFLVPPKNVEGLKPGEIRDLGDWKAEAGTHVKGRIVEEGTKKPIPGASVQLWGRGNGGDDQSDNDGAFDFLAASDAVGLAVRADGFVSQQKQDVPDPKNGAIDLGTITLKHGQKIAGVVKNEAGAPQSISLYAEGKGDRVYARSNEGDGNFSFDGLQEGNYTIKSDEFKVVSGDKFSIGATATAALAVVVEGKDKAQGASKVEGHVLDENNQPVAGAKIKLQIRSGNSYSSPTVISNTDGTYSLPISMQNATPKVTGVSRPGFILGTSALKNEGDAWRGDILLQKRGSALKGRVVDAQGRPVAHAFVGLSTGFDLPVATDDTGAFTMKDAPTRGVTLLASDGPRLASLALEKAGDALITLPDAAPIEDRAALADEVLSRSRLGYEWESKWDVLGEKRIEAAFIRAGTDQWSWRGFLQILAEREPATLLAREAELREKTPPGDRAGFERVLMLARASSTDEAQRSAVKDWLAAQEAEKRDISTGTVTQLLGLAQVAAKLDPKTGAMWLDYAAQIAAQLPNNGGDNSWDWGALAASISPDAPQSLVEDWSPSAALQLLGRAMGVYAKRGDVAGARKTFALMEQLAKKAEQTPDKDVKVEGYHQKPKDLLNQGREQWARTLALSDPGAALEAATPLEDYRRAQVLIVIAKNAVKLKQLDVARRALNLVFEVNTGNVEFFAQAAGVAQTFDAALADEMFARAFDKAVPKDEGYGGWTPSLAAFAQERAGKWPGQSRILIEREWVTRLEIAKKPTDNDYDSNGRSMQGLVGAMAPVAPRRALEMAEQVTEKQNLRLEARGDVAVALLTKG